MNSPLTTDEQALMNAIVAAPDDDAPRLIYADWLDENGQAERADFIRVQCELARLSKWVDQATWRRYQELRVRETHLLARHKLDWTGGPLGSSTVQFRRGFVTASQFPWSQLAALQEESFGWPLLSDFTVSELDPVALTQLFEWSILQQARALHLRSHTRLASRVSWEQLATITLLSQLRALSLHFGQPMYERTAAKIAATTALAQVIDFTFNVQHQSHLLEILLQGAAFQRLQRLATFANGYTPYFPDILQSSHLATLEELLLDGYSLDENTIEEMISAPFWSSLRRLTLNTYALLPQTIARLGTAPALRLHTVSFSRNLDEGIEALVGPFLHNVQSLEFVTQLGMTVPFLERLGNSEHTCNLRRLRIAQNANFGDAAASIVANATSLRDLFELDLSGTGMTNKGAKALAESPYLDNLTSLVLWDCPINEHMRTVLTERFGYVQNEPRPFNSYTYVPAEK